MKKKILRHSKSEIQRALQVLIFSPLYLKADKKIKAANLLHQLRAQAI